MVNRGFSTLIVILVLAIPLAFFLGLFISQRSPSSPLPILTTIQKKEVFSEKIPGSKFHSPDATWWGYNQNKIVRFKDKVFSYYIENNDDSSKTSSKFVVIKKDGQKLWEEGAMFPTSRPGNLLIDSKGVLHAFVFEPFNVSENDSWGKIIHYFFPNSASGDITNFKKELIVDNDGKSETANIRVGSAISKDDTMVISFGLTNFNPLYKGQSEHIYFKKPDDTDWAHLIAGEDLGHDFYYPFTYVLDNQFYLLPIQDDYVPPEDSTSYPNIYQKILLFEYTNQKWNKETVIDLSNHPLALERARLLEQEELFVDKDKNIHIIYKEFLDPKSSWAATNHIQMVGKLGNWKTTKISLDQPGIQWVKLIEVDNNLYYLMSSFDKLYVRDVNSEKFKEIKIPEDAKGFYPYIATPRDGTKQNEFIDILLLGADQKLFQEKSQTNYYLRIPKSFFSF